VADKNILVRVLGDTSDLQQKLRAAGSDLKDVGANFQQVGSAMTQVGTRMTAAITVPILGVAGAATKMGADFESTMTQINTLVGVNQDQVKSWSRDLLKLGPEVGKSPRELAEALFFVTSAGLRGQEAIDTLTFSAQASAVGLGETKTVADAVTSAMNAYGPAVLDAEKATNILIATVREGKTEPEDLASSLGRVIPLASQMGITFGEVGGFIATFTRLGVSSREAVTGLRAALTAFNKPTQEGIDLARELGFSFEDLRRKAGEEGLAKTLIDLFNVVEGDTEKLVTLIPQVQGLTGVMATAGAQAETFKEIEASVGGETEALGQGFATTSEIITQAWNRIKASFESGFILIFEGIRPVIAQVTKLGEIAGQVFIRIAEGFANLPEGVRFAIVALAGLLAAIGPVVTVAGVLLTTIGAVIGAFAVFSTAAAGAVLPAILALGVTVGLVVAKVALLAGAFILAWKRSEEFRTRVKELIDELKETAGPAIRDITELMGAVFEKVKALWEFISPQVIGVVTAMFELIIGRVVNMGKIVINAVALIVNILQGDWDEAWQNILGILTGVLDLVVGAVKATLKLIENVVVLGLKALAALVFEGVKQILRPFAWLKDQLVDNSIIPEMVDAVGEQFEIMRDKAIEESKKLAAGVEIAIRGVRRSFEQMVQDGRPAIEQLAEAFDRATKNMASGVGNVVNKVAEFSAMRGSLTEIGEAFEVVGRSVKANVTDLAVTGFNALRKAMVEGVAQAEETKDGLSELGDEIDDGRKQVAQYIEALEDTAATLGLTADEADDYRLAVDGATRAEIEHVRSLRTVIQGYETVENRIEEAKKDLEAWRKSTVGATGEFDDLKGVMVEVEVTMDDVAESAAHSGSVFKDLDAITQGALSSIGDSIGDLRSLVSDAFSSSGQGILKTITGFGASLAAMAGPAGVIFNAVQSIGNLFGIDLFGAVMSALKKIGSAVGGFFKRLFGGGDDLKGTLGLEGGLEEEDIVRVQRTLDRNRDEPFGQLSDLLERLGLSEEDRTLFLAEKLAEGTALGLEGEDSRQFFRDVIEQILEGRKFGERGLNEILGKVLDEFFVPPEKTLDERIDDFFDRQFTERGIGPGTPTGDGSNLMSSLSADLGLDVAVDPSVALRVEVEGKEVASEIPIDLTGVVNLDGRKVGDMIGRRMIADVYTSIGQINK